MFEEALSYLYLLLKLTQTDITIEHYAVEVVRTEFLKKVPSCLLRLEEEGELEFKI